MGIFGNLFGGKKEQNDEGTASTDATEEIQALLSQASALLPKEWKTSDDGTLIHNASMQVPYAMLGVMSLAATIMPKDGAFEYSVKINCLPLQVSGSETAPTLDEAKEKVKSSILSQGVNMLFMLKQLDV